jgi:superfamily I DNA/RNA helicase
LQKRRLKRLGRTNYIAATVFNGPAPIVEVADSADQERSAVAERLRGWLDEGLARHEIAVFVRSAAELPRAQAAVDAAGLPSQTISERMETTHGLAAVSTMHLAKGLEFRAVAVMACDDEVVPLQDRIFWSSWDSRNSLGHYTVLEGCRKANSACA